MLQLGDEYSIASQREKLRARIPRHRPLCSIKRMPLFRLSQRAVSFGGGRFSSRVSRRPQRTFFLSFFFRTPQRAFFGRFFFSIISGRVTFTIFRVFFFPSFFFHA